MSFLGRIFRCTVWHSAANPWSFGSRWPAVGIGNRRFRPHVSARRPDRATVSLHNAPRGRLYRRCLRRKRRKRKREDDECSQFSSGKQSFICRDFGRSGGFAIFYFSNSVSLLYTNLEYNEKLLWVLRSLNNVQWKTVEFESVTIILMEVL